MNNDKVIGISESAKKGASEKMEKVRVKICGMRRIEDIRLINEVKPEYCGFVFAGKLRRIDDETARILKAELNPDILAVGVFVDEPIEHVISLCKNKIIDAVQLHGNESAEYISKLKEETGVSIIDARKIRSKEDAYEAFKTKADFLLFDAYSKAVPGGSGETFNWLDILDGRKQFEEEFGVKADKKFFIAGGMSCANAKNVIDVLHPFAIDISSSLEGEGNFKDRNKVVSFMQKMLYLNKDAFSAVG